MKFLVLFTLVFTTFSSFASTYEVDFSLDPSRNRDVFERKLFDRFDDSRQVILYTTKYEDGFDTVLDNTEKVWSDKVHFKCEYVKVFYWEKKPEALKLGLRTVKFDLKRENDRSIFFLKLDGKWSEVERKVYFDFLRDRNLPNYSHKGYEKDERFTDVDKLNYEDTEIALRPFWADLRSKPKPLPKDLVDEKPTKPDTEDVEAPPVGGENNPFPPKEPPAWADPDNRPVTDDKDNKVKRRKNLKEETSSFLTSSLLLPAVMVAFYITH